MFRLGGRVILSTNKKYFSGKKMGVIMFLLKLGYPLNTKCFSQKIIISHAKVRNQVVFKITVLYRWDIYGPLTSAILEMKTDQLLNAEITN